jgi:trimeric autotransporter adhesin
MKSAKLSFCAFVLLAGCTMNAQQTTTNPVMTVVPRLVNFSGKAMNGEKIITGAAGVTFAIFSEQSGGAPLWLETQNIQADTNGNYVVQLGATKPEGLPLDLFTSGEARWLGVRVNGGEEQPRILLLSVPYALKAADAETIGGLPPSAFVLAAPTASGASSVGAVNSSSAPPVNPGVTGVGIVGSVPLWDTTSDITSSILTQTGSGSTGRIGVNITTPAATLDVKGTSNFRGTVGLPSAGIATASGGKTSYPLAFVASVFNSGTATAVSQNFRWQAEPVGNDTTSVTGTLNLLFGVGTSTPAETGLKIANNGQITFAPGQTFPGGTGTGTITGVTAGTDLTGGGTSGKVTLNLDTTKVPQLSAANVFTNNQTVKGNLAVGTGTLLSILQATATAPEALGPSLTLTNNVGNGDFGGSSVDFNTYAPSTGGSYNPSSRIEAFGDGRGGDSLWFLSNNDQSLGGPNQGLALNMNIGSNGRVEIGGGDTDPNDFFEQLVVNSEPLEGSEEVAAIGAFGGTPTGVTDANGSNGIYAVGGDGVGNAQADFAGDGGEFYGGFTPESSSGAAGYGIYATGGVGGVGVAAYAGYFDGNIEVTGTVFGSVKDFRIDHPLDPANKYLYHASVESSEMMNIYTGNVITDELGLATVKLPEWFEAENTDFRYQLTVIGRRAQAWIAEEVDHGQFKIASDATHTKISWQITAVRQDAFAKAHPLIVEQAKPASERGFYQNPEVFGQPAERQTEWGRRPQEMERMKEARVRQKLAARKPFTHSRDQPAKAVDKQQPSLAVAAH